MNGLRSSGVLPLPIRTHQGGWDEALILFGAPIVLFAILRWLGLRRERKERDAAERGDEIGGA